MTVRWRTIAVLVAVCAALLVVILATRNKPSQEQAFSYKRELPLDISRERLKAPVTGISVERLTFTSVPGERVPARLVRSASRTGEPGPCLIFMNGFGTSAEDAVAPLAGIAEAGVPVLVMDARLNGEREPRSGARAASVRDAKQTAATLRGSVIDVRRALDVLGAEHECDPSRIAVVGSSQGAMVMTMASAVDPRIAASALLMPSPDARAARTALRRVQPGALPDLAAAERELGPLMPVKWLPQIDPEKPVLLMRAEHDEVVPVGASKRLFDIARRDRPETQLRVSPGGHEPFSGTSAPTVAREVIAFLSRSLKAGDLEGITALAAATPAYSRSVPLRATSRPLPSPNDAIQLKRVRFTSSDQQRVPALLLLPDGKRTPARNCVIAMGGSGTSAAQVAQTIGGLTAAGVPALVLDARLNGERKTKSGSLADAVRNPLRAAALIGGTVVDVRRSIDYLESTGRCRRGGVALVGVDEAAYIMLATAGADERTRTTILMTSTAPEGTAVRARPEPVARVAVSRSPTPPDSWLQMIRRDGGILPLEVDGTRPRACRPW